MANPPTYLKTLSDPIPPGMVVVHNHVRPTRRLGSRGFRAWVELPDPDKLEACPCGWAPELGEHYRIRGIRRD